MESEEGYFWLRLMLKDSVNIAKLIMSGPTADNIDGFPSLFKCIASMMPAKTKNMTPRMRKTRAGPFFMGRRILGAGASAD